MNEPHCTSKNRRKDRRSAAYIRVVWSGHYIHPSMNVPPTERPMDGRVVGSVVSARAIHGRATHTTTAPHTTTAQYTTIPMCDHTIVANLTYTLNLIYPTGPVLEIASGLTANYYMNQNSSSRNLWYRVPAWTTVQVHFTAITTAAPVKPRGLFSWLKKEFLLTPQI